MGFDSSAFRQKFMVLVVKRLRPRVVIPIYVGSNPIKHPNKYASETWKSERSYTPFSARLAFLRGFDSLRWYQCPAGQIGKVISLKRRSSPCSNQGKGTMLEDDAGGMVRRRALKTRFSEMGWGSTPPSSAKLFGNSVMVTPQTLTLLF